MPDRLTLAQIAPLYNKTPKAFSRFVKEKGIPHDLIGREYSFILSEVEAYLLKLRVANNVVDLSAKLPPKRKRSILKSKFAEAV